MFKDTARFQVISIACVFVVLFLSHVWFIDFIYIYIYLFIFSIFSFSFFFFLFLFAFILFVFFFFFFLFHFSLFIFFIYLFFVIVICYFDLSQNFYCHGVSIFFLDSFTCTSLLGFVYLDLSTWISLGSKCLLHYV